ncbi:MAG: twin-arginine translocation signal domain-containing protein [Candidatus Hydrogenedentes bacterium]|nr:twin-arginine translocation signal domain-containing protein [Candidatus Hydrogenedentota bacterium]
MHRRPLGDNLPAALSRRSFLQHAAAGAAALAIVNPANVYFARPGLDTRSLPPNPQVRIAHVVLRHKPSHWVGWPGTAYDLEGRRRDCEDIFSKAAQRAGVMLDQPGVLLDDETQVEAYVERLDAAPPHAVLINLQHFDAWPWTDFIAATGVPVVVFAPVNAGFSNTVRSVADRPGVHVISSFACLPVEQAFRLIRAKCMREESPLPAIG